MGWEATRAASPVMAEGCQTMKAGLLVEAGGGKYAGQSRPGALVAKSAAVQGLLALWMSSLSAREMCCLAMACFEGEDAGGAGFGLGEAGELEHGGDVGAVLRADVASCVASQ